MSKRTGYTPTKADRDNRSQQLNPNNDRYQWSREGTAGPVDQQERSTGNADAGSKQS